MVAIKGHFDGQVFIPDEPVNLPRNQPVILHIEPTAQPTANAQPVDSFFDVLASLTGTVEAPKDWATEHNHYLYGTNKHGNEETK